MQWLEMKLVTANNIIFIKIKGTLYLGEMKNERPPPVAAHFRKNIGI
jgi:hypothetical protein